MTQARQSKETRAAHAFLRAVAGDDALRRDLARGEMTAEAVIAAGAQRGFAFDATALQQAYRQNFQLRWVMAQRSEKSD